ncbi:Uncharacterised protein [Mycobacteroides abscessus subsp. abscessus]|nr:Uncharacterised protein [Mycobacteroides abscessus subsp. abscessus]
MLTNRSHQPVFSLLPPLRTSWVIKPGMYSRDDAKMTGITPAWLTFSGK